MSELLQLPDEQEILRRLCGVCDKELLRETFYKEVAYDAGETVSPTGLITVLLASLSHVEYDLMMAIPELPAALMLDMPRYIDALAAEDKEFADSAKSELAELQELVKNKQR